MPDAYLFGQLNLSQTEMLTQLAEPVAASLCEHPCLVHIDAVPVHRMLDEMI